jgi:hypothetical protein
VEAAKPTLGTRDIKISKIIPSVVDDQAPTTEEAENMRDSFAHLATIEYQTIHGSRIRMGDLDVATNEYFKKDGGWSFRVLGRNRVFTGPDGREYFWSLGALKCKLFVKDSAETPVACFHLRQLGVIGDAQPASLEIFSAGKDMVDLIVVTGAYMEKVRKNRERAAKW